MDFQPYEDYGQQEGPNVVRFERSISNLTLHDIYDTYEDLLVKYGLVQVKGIVQRMFTPQRWLDYQKPPKELFSINKWSYCYSHKIHCNMNAKVTSTMTIKAFETAYKKESLKLTSSYSSTTDKYSPQQLYWNTIDQSFYGPEGLETLPQAYTSYYGIKCFSNQERSYHEHGFKGNWCQHQTSFGYPRNVMTKDIMHHEDSPVLEGMASPHSYYYQGTDFSSFPHHFEDYWLPSVNYHYNGAEKYWIGCPASDTKLVWNVIKMAATQMKRKPDEKKFIISPRMLWEFGGIPHTEIHQQPGDMVISASGATHGGFNLGRNTAEAINFADSYSDAFDGWVEMVPEMAEFFMEERGRSIPDTLLQAAGIEV